MHTHRTQQRAATCRTATNNHTLKTRLNRTIKHSTQAQHKITVAPIRAATQPCLRESPREGIQQSWVSAVLTHKPAHSKPAQPCLLGSVTAP